MRQVHENARISIMKTALDTDLNPTIPASLPPADLLRIIAEKDRVIAEHKALLEEREARLKEREALLAEQQKLLRLLEEQLRLARLRSSDPAARNSPSRASCSTRPNWRSRSRKSNRSWPKPKRPPGRNRKSRASGARPTASMRTCRASRSISAWTKPRRPGLPGPSSARSKQSLRSRETFWDPSPQNRLDLRQLAGAPAVLFDRPNWTAAQDSRTA